MSPERKIRSSVQALREIWVCLLIDELGLFSKLKKGFRSKLLTNTETIIMEAASALKIVNLSNQKYEFNKKSIYYFDNLDDWKRLISIVKHHKSYIELSLKTKLINFKPEKQIELDPNGYKLFLKGVEQSHFFHKDFLLKIPELNNSKSLIDIGCGLGTFSFSWINSKKDRTAILLDLTSVKNYLSGRLNSKLKFISCKLPESNSIPKSGDVYLLANILHLFSNIEKSKILKDIYFKMPIGARLVILDTEPNNQSGKLFNLQVHMRSGFTGYLISSSECRKLCKGLGFVITGISFFKDNKDPFSRRHFIITLFKPDETK